MKKTRKHTQLSSKQTWDLDLIFKGGSTSKSFQTFLKKLETIINTMMKTSSIKQLTSLWQQASESLTEAESFIHCLQAQNVKDSDASILKDSISEIRARYDIAVNKMDSMLKSLSEKEFKKLLQDPDNRAIAFHLEEKRSLSKEKLDDAQEALVTDLSVDGYHSWSQLYETLIGRTKIPFTTKKTTQDLSWGQAYNLLSHPDRKVRQEIFKSSNTVWDKEKEIYANVLNHIAGFRLKLYNHRKWPFLKEPLANNRMEEATLDMMWKVVNKNKTIFLDYLKCKAKLLGCSRLSWYDLEAPLAFKGQETSINYKEGTKFIIDSFAKFSPKMADFAKKAFSDGWIEATDRNGKQAGGFCTDFPVKKQTRVFMTYSGSQESLFILAHELGHAFHTEVMFDLPECSRRYPSNLAETASTFAEMLVSESTLVNEKDPQQKLMQLDARLQRSVIFLCNIHSRFLFETEFYEKRQKGFISSQNLCEMMVEAQKKGYHDSLDEYHPYFWVSKIHFNLTDVPFYNFPYTFGYLFSLGIYLYLKELKNPEESYISLLRDTGNMTTEDLAEKHLGVDLRKPDFWQRTLDFLKRDAKAFLELSKSEKGI